MTPEVAKSYPGKNFITRAIGTETTVLCDIFHLDVGKGDYLLLCSDGLSNLLDGFRKSFLRSSTACTSRIAASVCWTLPKTGARRTMSPAC